jgi:hypothetical protein
LQIQTSYTIDQKIKSLSERLKYLARSSNTYENHIDQGIKSENLEYNLSFILANIIINLEFVDRGKEVFITIINEYNKANNKNLTIKEFEDKSWVRTINNEIVIPTVVNSYIYHINRKEKEKKPVDIPKENEDLIKCLSIYQEKCFSNARLYISKERLEALLKKHSPKEINIDFLITKQVIGLAEENGLYFWKINEYIRHIRNEIASTIWILIGGSGATEADFRKYIKLLVGAGIWIDDLTKYLTRINISRLRELALSMLRSESDLLKSDLEFSKIWLDSEAYVHVDIKTEIPQINFNFDNTVDFIEDVYFHKWRFQGIFDYQRNRSTYLMILRMVVSYDSKYSTLYENVLNLLKDTSRPYLVWSLYQQISREFPKVIPYLLLDSETNSLPFNLIDKVSIDQILLSEQSNKNKQFEENCQVINDIWLEMFDITLEQFEFADPNNNILGKAIGKILIDVSQNVFGINSGNINNTALHNSYRVRYDEVLKKISNKRPEKSVFYSNSVIIPRLLFYLLPSIFDYLKEYYSKQRTNHIEHLKINTSFIDLSIEVLRLLNISSFNSEIPDNQKNKIEKISKELTLLIGKHLENYYSLIEIEVYTYSSIIKEKRAAIRGVNEFGFEIIDWGYLYLHFQKNDIIDSIDNIFRNSLNFKTDEDEYDNQNKEQAEKIKSYAKSLMLAYLFINKKADINEANSLPVYEALTKLEGLIMYYSLTYSTNNVAIKSIDLFNERFSYNNDIHRQSLMSLLHRCINIFTGVNKNKFVEDFFKKSSDVGSMLTAINIIDSKELKNIITTRLNKVKLENFIASVSTITELENTLIEAINSDSHWHYSDQLIEKIEGHYEKSTHFDENSKIFLFEIKLLLAFKLKDFIKLTNNEIPIFSSNENKLKGDNLKQYFTALFKVYVSENYIDGIKILESLVSRNVHKIDYYFHLFRAKTLKAVYENQHLSSQLLQNWNLYTEGVEENDLLRFSELICLTKIHYYILQNDFSHFESAITQLSPKYLFDNEILIKVFNFYLNNKHEEAAYEYIKRAEAHFIIESSDIPIELKELIINFEKVGLPKVKLHIEELIEPSTNGQIDTPENTDVLSMKMAMERLLHSKPKTILNILPEIHNGEKNLDEFILIEVLQGLKMMLDKKSTLTRLKEENEINDILQVTLKSRIALWGWHIPDQSRVGDSDAGKDAGEADFLVQSGTNNIALIEALILESKNKTKTELHIRKCFKYMNYLGRFYIIIYFKGPSSNFDLTWTGYKSDILQTNFPKIYSLNSKENFIDLSEKWDDYKGFKIEQTNHNNGSKVFHIMINLGS